jgi:precorrin-2 dehydrogenase/sirohydrochlorin ferrochelatase
MFPVFFDLRGRLVLVVGAGEVGRRRADALLEAGALVRLVCLEPRPVEWSSSTLEWCQAPYQSSHLTGVVLAFAASLPEVNAQVVADAQGRNLPVNSSTDPAAGDFVTPATVRRGVLVLAISTGGAAPGLARRIRERLQAEFDGGYADWVALLKEVRPGILRAGIASEQRRALFDALTEWSWLERIRHDGIPATREAMRLWLAERGIGDTL